MPNSPINEDSLRNVRSMPNHVGQSGAVLLHAELGDGTAVVVKRSHPETDLFQRLLGHRINLEYQLWADGTLNRLPTGVSSPVIGAWVDGEVATVVMHDLGDAILGGSHRFSSGEAIQMLHRLDALHRSGIRPSVTTSLDAVVNTFALPRVQTVAPEAAIVKDVARGWVAFERIAPKEIACKVLEIVLRPKALVAALASRAESFCHGDVAAVNMAWQGDRLVLIDWGQSFVGPAALDIARFLPSGLRSSELDNDWFLRQYALVAGDRFDEVALRLSLLATLVWFGWRKALDTTEGSSAELRSADAKALEWWCEQADRGLHELI
jgi:hypothetical protein